MGHYRVILNGKGIRLESPGEPPVIGFVTTRAVKAGSSEEAVETAKRLVAELWSSAEYKAMNKGTPPELTTVEVEAISAWAAFRTPNKGHVFYGVK